MAAQKKLSKKQKEDVREFFIGIFPEKPTTRWAKANDYKDLDDAYSQLYQYMVEEKSRERKEKQKRQKRQIEKYEGMVKQLRKREEVDRHVRIRRSENKEKGCIFRCYHVSPAKDKYIMYDFNLASISKAWNGVQQGEVLYLDAFESDKSIIRKAVNPPNGNWDILKEIIDWNPNVLEGQHTWDAIVEKLKEDDNDTYGKISHLLNYLVIVEILWVGDSTEISNRTEEFPKRRLRDAVNQKLISSKYTVFKVNPQFTSFDNFLLLDEDILEELKDLKNSCMVKSIIKTYKKNFDKYFVARKDPQMSKLRLTIGHIVEICKGEEYIGGEVELTVEEAQRFFEHYRLGVEFYNMNHELMHKYHPVKLHSDIQPAIMRIIYHNEHVQKITEIKSFERTCTNQDNNNDKPVSSFCKTKDEVINVADMECHIVSSYEDIIEKLKVIISELSTTELEEKDIKIKFIYNDYLQDILKRFLADGYNPIITTAGRINVDSITIQNLEVNDDISIDIHIRTACIADGHTKSNFTDVDKYKQFVHESSKFENVLLNSDNVSHMSSNVLQAIDLYGIQIHCGKIVDECMHNRMQSDFVCLDNCKFYATCLRDCPYIPVVSPFDEFVKPDSNHVVQSDNLYIVKLLFESKFHNKGITLMYGFELKELDIPHTIVAFIPIIKRPIGDISSMIEHIYSDKCKLETSIKKVIPNKTIGMTGKKYNRRRTTMAFNNEHDADLWMKEHKMGAKFPLDENIWIVTMIEEQRLENGFLPIYQMVLSMARMKLYRQYKELTKLGMQVVGFKTDAIFIRTPKTDLQINNFESFKKENIRNELGGMKIEEGKLPPDIPLGKIIVDENKHSDFKKSLKISENIHIDLFTEPEFDEYNFEETNARIQNRTVAMSFAGRGKSHAVINYAKSKYGIEHVLVVCAWNAQAQNVTHKYGVAAITYHRLRGEALHGKSTKTAYDTKDVKCIIFDEIMLFTHKQLVKIYRYIDDKPEIEYLATCDPSQLESIGDITSNDIKKRHILCEKLFPNLLALKENKRMSDENHKAKLYEIERDLFVNKLSPMKVVKKYFSGKEINSLEEMKEMNICRGVSYLDSTSKTLNSHIHSYYKHSRKMITKVKTLVNGITYYYGGSLICKANMKVKAGKMYPNYEYTIVKMNNKAFTLQDVLYKTEYEVTVDAIVKNFSLPYVNTVHSSQGSDIPQKYVIADWFLDGMVTANWIYTAITRARNLDDIYFLCADTTCENIESVAKHMVAGYKIQDRKAKRDFDDEMFVTPDWIISEYSKSCRCHKCGEYMTFEKHAKHKVSVNRRNNSLPHTMSNCELMCVLCNTSIRNLSD